MPDIPYRKLDEPYETVLGHSHIADGIIVATVSFPEDETLGKHSGKSCLLFDFSAAGQSYPPMLLLLDDYDAIPGLVRTAVDTLKTAPPYKPAPKDVRCPGCNTLLHGTMARRGGCGACYPKLPGDADGPTNP